MGVCRKVPENTRTSLKLRIFRAFFFNFGRLRLFRVFLGTFLQTPKATLFETFFGFRAPETPVNGGSGLKQSVHKTCPTHPPTFRVFRVLFHGISSDPCSGCHIRKGQVTKELLRIFPPLKTQQNKGKQNFSEGSNSKLFRTSSAPLFQGVA